MDSRVGVSVGGERGAGVGPGVGLLVGTTTARGTGVLLGRGRLVGIDVAAGATVSPAPPPLVRNTTTNATAVATTRSPITAGITGKWP